MGGMRASALARSACSQVLREQDLQRPDVELAHLVDPDLRAGD